MIFSDVEEYKELIERAVIAAIAGFSLEESEAIGDKDKPWYNYVNLNSFISRIIYWLRTAEYIPDSNKFEQVSGKAIELLKKLTLWKEGRSYPGPGGIHIELKGDIVEIYNALGFSFPAYKGFGSFPGEESYYANWGRRI